MVVAAVTLFAACHSSYRATDTTVVVAPSDVQTAFTTQYPSATEVVWSNYDQAMVPIDWDLSGWATPNERDYLVRFNMENENYYAWYDDSGSWIGTAYVIKDTKTVPDVVTNTINKQFSDYTITGINKEFQKDRMVYEVELKNNDNKVKMLIDANGNIIKQKTKPLN